MSHPTPTPYDGSARPFTIGLSPLDPDAWIEPDADLAVYLDEKSRLESEHRQDIFRAAPDMLEAQQEVLDLLVAHLTDRHCALYRRAAGRIDVAGRSIDLKDTARPPLLIAGSFVQDDLVLMRRREAGWTLAAAHLAFPSSWSLAEKFGLGMDAIHAGVPGFAGGTRNAVIINRIFDHLQPDAPVIRYNWSINWGHALHHPPGTLPADPAAPDLAAANAFVRVERQTLRRLAFSGDILFTIRIYLDPVARLVSLEDPAPARGLAAQLAALDPAQLRYKGLAPMRDVLLARLAR